MSYIIYQYSNLSSHSKPTLTPTATFSTSLGGVDLVGYCKSLGYSTLSGDEFCSSDIALDNACSVSNGGRTDLHFKLDNPQNPYSGACYTSQEMSTGGVDLSDYCKAMRHKGSVPYATIVNNTWVCQIKVDMIAACGWQNNKHNLQARKDDQDQWACYGD